MTGSFESMLSGLFSDDSEGDGTSERTTLPLGACIAALKDHARRLTTPCPFKCGDVVTVRPGTDVKGAGNPHVVVEVLTEPVTDRTAEGGSNRFLAKYTMRVAHFHGDTMTVHAVDHCVFEAWHEGHEAAWTSRQTSTSRKNTARPLASTPLNEVVRLLRAESKKFTEAKITWKKGDLVEILGHETSRAAKPMLFEGKAVGVVERVDHSDDTTRVIYFDDDGDRRTQWFKPVDLKPFSAVEPVSA